MSTDKYGVKICCTTCEHPESCWTGQRGGQSCQHWKPTQHAITDALMARIHELEGKQCLGDRCYHQVLSKEKLTTASSRNT